MKTFLVIWLIIGGVDHGGPPMVMPSMDECQKVADKMIAEPLPDGVDHLAVGCVRQRDAGEPT